MATLKLIDPNLATVYSFAPTCKTTEEAQAELTGRGWTNKDALDHISAAITAGAYAKAITYPTRQERIARAGDKQTENTDGR